MDQSERFLGLNLDTKLTWNHHIELIKNKVKFKIHQLRKIAYSDTYRLSTHAIWKLYLTVIRPIIEYGITIYSASSKFDELETLQYQAARIALRVKSTTPRCYLT